MTERCRTMERTEKHRW